MNEVASQPEEGALFGRDAGHDQHGQKVGGSVQRSDGLSVPQPDLSPVLQPTGSRFTRRRAKMSGLSRFACSKRPANSATARWTSWLTNTKAGWQSLRTKLRRGEAKLQKGQSAYDAVKQQEMLSAGDLLLSLFSK